ncbi:MAG: hypothetical protein ACOC7T_05675 [Planctomycetota bacterium]
MRSNELAGDGGMEQVRQAYREALAENRKQREALAAIRELLAEMAAQNLALHRRTLATLEAMNRDVRRFKRQLKNLSSART